VAGDMLLRGIRVCDAHGWIDFAYLPSDEWSEENARPYQLRAGQKMASTFAYQMG
jgi:hypothetical protein